ncbi:MAG: AraC family transcriptional regulator [Ruminococcus sp.]|nr:AraC family transcriptional regulator [Ruminococcus sp.]
MLNEYCFGEIYIRHAVDECPDNKGFSMHIHEQCEIYFFCSGNVEYLVEGSNYFLTEGTIMIMRPAESHMPKIIGNSRYERYALNFPISFAASFDPEGRLMKPFISRPLGKNNMYDTAELDMKIVRRLFEEMSYGGDDYDKHLTINTHLFILLDMISRAFNEKAATEHKPQSVSESIVMYVNSHLFEELSIPKLAKHFYFSPSQFNRVFRQATGAAPWEYITKKRLTAAKEKIRNGHSAQNACEACGFKDYSNFYRAYTKHFGCTPKEDSNNTN